MNFVSLRLITNDVKRLADFYQAVTGLPPTWYRDEFVELTTRSCVLAIGSKRTMDSFGAGAAPPADNHTAIIEFRVADVYREYEKLQKIVRDSVLAPTTQPWGKPCDHVLRPGRQFDQLLHAGQRQGDQEIRRVI